MQRLKYLIFFVMKTHKFVDVDTSCVLNMWTIAVWSDSNLDYVELPDRYRSQKEALSAVVDFLNTPGYSSYLRDYRILHSMTYYLYRS